MLHATAAGQGAQARVLLVQRGRQGGVSRPGKQPGKMWKNAFVALHVARHWECMAQLPCKLQACTMLCVCERTQPSQA